MATAFLKFIGEAELDHFEGEHIEVLYAIVADLDLGSGQSESVRSYWAGVFKTVAAYVFVALIDPELHALASQIVHVFWKSNLCLNADEDADVRATFLQTLRVLYSHELERAKVDPESMLDFLSNVSQYDQAAVKNLLADFKAQYYTEFCNSNLHSL